MCSCCATQATARISAIGCSASMCAWPNACGCRETTLSVPTARPRETSGIRSADLNPDVRRMFASRKSGAASLMSLMIIGSRERTTPPSDRALDLEDNLRPRARAALLLLDPSRVGLKLPAVVGEQGQADAIARHQSRDARGQRLEGQRHVDRARDDIEHRVLRLELVDFGQRRAYGPVPSARDGARGR